MAGNFIGQLAGSHRGSLRHGGTLDTRPLFEDEDPAFSLGAVEQIADSPVSQIDAIEKIRELPDETNMHGVPGGCFDKVTVALGSCLFVTGTTYDIAGKRRQRVLSQRASVSAQDTP